MLNVLQLTILLCSLFAHTTTPTSQKNVKSPAAVLTFQLFVYSPSQSYAGLEATIQNVNTGETGVLQSFQVISDKGVFQFGTAGDEGQVFNLTVKSGTTTVASGTYTITATNTHQHYVATTVYMSY
ncbi:hypothetical protein [Chitinophaga sp.]|uniref:hypothetical protein n=1 Tax=Chitinophaga sp. TaxID=1869181 RepID=UPI0031E39B02